MNARLGTVRRKLEEIGLDAILITDITNIRYLISFTGSSGILIITHEKAVFVTDFRYKIQAEDEVVGVELRIEKDKRPETIRDIINDLEVKTLGFEARALSFELYSQLSERLNTIKLRPTKDLVEELRSIKEESELSFIKNAITVAEEAFRSIFGLIRPAVRERDISLSLEYELKKRGSALTPFDIIVAAGERAALPHARTSENFIKEGDLVIIDWGAESGGYLCDISRTFLPGGKRDIEKEREIYEIVLSAQREAIEKAVPGMSYAGLDAIARDFIKDAGYGEYFSHGLGHGVGLSIHEAPHISWQGEGVLKEGMVFTIEPGIYIPGFGGVRIEDMVFLKEDGAKFLTSLRRELIVI